MNKKKIPFDERNVGRGFDWTGRLRRLDRDDTGGISAAFVQDEDGIVRRRGGRPGAIDAIVAAVGGVDDGACPDSFLVRRQRRLTQSNNNRQKRETN